MADPPNSEIGAEVESLVEEINILQKETGRDTTVTQDKDD